MNLLFQRMVAVPIASLMVSILLNSIYHEQITDDNAGSYFSFPSFEHFEDVQKGKLNQESQPHLEAGSLEPMSR